MALVDMLFLSPINYRRSTRERELEESEKKAHAARISHQRNRQRRPNFQTKGRPQQKGQHSRQKGRELLQKQHDALVFLHGCSDPFNAFPLQVTPETNYLIAYIRVLLLPTLVAPPFMKRLTLG